MDAMAAARSLGKIARVLFVFVFLQLRRLVLGVLVLYWLIFVGYTISNYFRGGLAWVIAWYAHISGDIFKPWNWKRFAIQQAFALALTITLSYFEWRRPKLAGQTRSVRL
jgi:hypothetical protein